MPRRNPQLRGTHTVCAACRIVLADIAPAPKISGNKLEGSGSVEPQESAVSDCFNGSRGWNRTNDQRINRDSSPEPIVPARDESET